MDADAARMLADLGLGRRDVLGTADDGPRSRASLVSPREQREVQREVESRRAQADRIGGGAGEGGGGSDGGAQGESREKILAAWNRESSFERDEVTEQLKNHSSGQGHRADLRRRLGTGSSPIDQSLPSRRGSGGAVAEFRGLLGSGPSTSPNPRRQPANLHRETMLREHNRERAPDPRLAGTTRFMNGERVTSSPGQPRTMRSGQNQTARVGVTTTTPPAATSTAYMDRPEYNRSGGPASIMMYEFAPQQGQSVATTTTPTTTPSAASVSHPAERLLGTIRPRANGGRSVLTPGGPRELRDLGREGAAAVRARAMQNENAPPTASESIVAPSFPSLQPSRPGPASVTASSTPTAPTTPAPVTSTSGGGRPSSSASAVTPSSTSKHSYADVQKFQMRALDFAASPGEKCNEYYNKFPDQENYFRQARNKIFMEIISLLKNANERDLKLYMETHKDRVWMIEAMKAAKKQVEENAGEDEIKEQCAIHQRYMKFLEAAREAFAPKDRVTVSVVQVDFAAPSEDVSKLERAGQSAEAPGQAAVGSTIVATPQEVGSGFSQVNGPPSPPSLTSVGSDSADESGTDPDLPHSSNGALNVIFWTDAHEVLGLDQVKVNVPAYFRLDIVPKSKRFDPLKLKSAIHRFADSLGDALMSSTTAPANSMEVKSPTSVIGEVRQRMQGAVLCDNDIWYEDEEEL